MRPSAPLALALVTLAACGSGDPFAAANQTAPTSTLSGDSAATTTAPTTATPTTATPTTATPTTATPTTATPTEASPLLRAVPRDASEDPSERNAADESGVLVVVDGCLSVENELGLTPIIWPFDATFDGTTVVTRIGRYAVGERILLGGGEVVDLVSVVVPDQLDQAVACSEAAASTGFHAQIG